MNKATPAGGKPIDLGIIARAGLLLAGKLESWFGPMEPQPISAPPNTPPRTIDYPVGWNLQVQPRTQETVTYAQMRSLAESFDLVRLCIETRKDELAKLKWEFTLKKKPDEKPKDLKGRTAKDDRLAMLADFFVSPDKEHTWQEWLRLALEDLFVIDAPAICPTADADGAVWTPGSKLYGLEVLDGATINRKVDYSGRTPASPAIAYQQLIKGIPSVNFTRDQLIYKPRNIRTHKFFGFGPVEQIIMTTNIGLRRQLHLLNYYTDGNVPEAIAMVPKEWSSDQISEFQQWFDSMLAGNSQQRRRINFIPEAGPVQFTRDPKLKDDLDEWLARIVCFAFSISPQAFIKQVNKGTGETAVEQAQAAGLTPIIGWIKDLINLNVLPKYFGINDIEIGPQATKDENPVEQSQIEDIALRNGSVTLDQVQEANGRDPLPNGAGSRNLVYTASGVVPIDTAIDNADNPPEPDPATAPGATPPKGKQPKKAYRGYPIRTRTNGHAEAHT